MSMHLKHPKRIFFIKKCGKYSIVCFCSKKCIQSNPRRGGFSLAVWMVYNSKTEISYSTIAHLRALEECLGKFLQLILASFEG